MTLNIFVVQEHHAQRAGLHWDFRLQSKDILLSWVLRKPPPIQIGVIHKVIRVNDHSLHCAQFSGEVSEGYGKGTVKIWDAGHMTYVEDRLDHQLVFILYGKKLVGKYCILPFQDYFLLYKLS